jgi:hypothetical protein
MLGLLIYCVYSTSMSSQSHDTRSVSGASLAPSSFFARHGAQHLTSPSGAAVSQEHAILEPFRYTCSVSGKGMRSKIIEVFNNWLKVSDACRMQTAAIVEKLHNASLIIGPFQGGVRVPCNAHHVYIISHTHLSQMISRTAPCSAAGGLLPTLCSVKPPASTAPTSYTSRRSTTPCASASRRWCPLFWTSS